MNWMNLHHLKYFLTIVEEGSISAASKKLLVGQPALSAQLKSFEEWIGMKLFDRIGKKLVITSSGEYVLKYAKEIMKLENELISGLSHAEHHIWKEFTIGVQESVPKSISTHAVSALIKVKPIHVKIIEGTGEELFQLLTESKIDVFIGNFRPMNSQKNIVYHSLGREKVSITGAKKYSALKRNFPNSLQNQKFILPGYGNQLRHDFEKFMLQAGLAYEVIIEAQDTALQKELAANGVGLIVLGDESTKGWVASGRLTKLGVIEGIKEEYWIGMVKRTLENDYIKAIINGLNP